MRGYDKNDPNSTRDVDRDGVPDNRDPVVHQPAVDPGVTREVRKDAYERGRADERSKHKRNPLLTILIALAAVFGLGVLGLYIYNGGSFTKTGEDLEAVEGRIATEAREAGREVADETGEALQDGGRELEAVGEGGSAGPPEPAPAQPAPERR